MRAEPIKSSKKRQINDRLQSTFFRYCQGSWLALESWSNEKNFITKWDICLIPIACLQYFEDYNKCTAGMMQFISLKNNGIIPLVLTQDNRELYTQYRGALVDYYKTGKFDLAKAFYKELRKNSGLDKNPKIKLTSVNAIVELLTTELNFVILLIEFFVLSFCEGFCLVTFLTSLQISLGF